MKYSFPTVTKRDFTLGEYTHSTSYLKDTMLIYLVEYHTTSEALHQGHELWGFSKWVAIPSIEN